MVTAIVGAASVAASVYASSQQGKAAKSAAQGASGAASDANAAQLQMYNQTRQDTLPQINAGQSASNQLAYLLGLRPHNSSGTNNQGMYGDGSNPSNPSDPQSYLPPAIVNKIAQFHSKSPGLINTDGTPEGINKGIGQAASMSPAEYVSWLQGVGLPSDTPQSYFINAQNGISYNTPASSYTFVPAGTSTGSTSNLPAGVTPLTGPHGFSYDYQGNILGTDYNYHPSSDYFSNTGGGSTNSEGYYLGNDGQKYSPEQYQAALAAQTAAATADPAANNNGYGSTVNTDTGAYGSLTHNFDKTDFLNNMDPAYQWDIDQGTQALQRTQSANGGLLSGAAAKSISDYTTNQASNEYGNAYNRYNTNQTNLYNRLAGVAGTGQQGASIVGTAGTNAANQIGSNTIGAANASGAAGIVGANSLSSGLGSILGNSNFTSGLNSLFGGSSYSSTGIPNGGFAGATGVPFNTQYEF